MKIKKEVKVVQNEEAPIAVEVMAESIKEISNGIKRLRSTRLNDKALHLLIQHACRGVSGAYSNSKPGLPVIRAVIESIESLEATYLKK